MEFDDHHHREEEEEEEASDEMMMGNDRNISGGGGGGEVGNSLSRVRMAEAFSQVQIQPTPTMIVPPPPPLAARPRYRECLKNHAVSVMGHAVDGCGEFMPGGPDGSLAALKCAACGCHRNFHRKEEVPVVYTHTPHLTHHQTPPGAFASYYRTSPSGYLQLGAPRARSLALPPSSGGNDDVSNPNGGGRASSDGKKRFRTKFTAEQKQQMLAMAERIGWRIQRGVEELVQQFCHEAAVKRHVFKVWMHNNKHTLGRISSTHPNTNTTNNNHSNGGASNRQHQLMN
uniref:ZF-HD dimerization-type domain-containing protein n=1 Tax=Kalanchoe fedtschenkoi TaxID=63787 RepID=A0A7N0T6K6_KALFE